MRDPEHSARLASRPGSSGFVHGGTSLLANDWRTGKRSRQRSTSRLSLVLTAVGRTLLSVPTLEALVRDVVRDVIERVEQRVESVSEWSTFAT